jgi:hypothetical protein
METEYFHRIRVVWGTYVLYRSNTGIRGSNSKMYVRLFLCCLV